MKKNDDGNNNYTNLSLNKIEYDEKKDKQKLEFEFIEKDEEDGKEDVEKTATLETKEKDILILDEEKGTEEMIEVIDPSNLKNKEDIEKNPSMWLNIQRKVVGTVLEVETQEALQEMFDTLRVFSKELKDYSWLSIIMACKIIALHDDTNKRTTSGNLYDNIPEMKEIILWWEYSRASLGWQYNLAWQLQKKFGGIVDSLTKSTDKVNKSIIAENCGINVEDILITNWSSKLLRPGYFLALDHNRQSIVIVIRGSFELKDTIIDLKAKKIEFMGGGVHEGMYIATMNVKEQMEKRFKEVKEQYPHYKIICTGYSLGASCAAIYAMMLLEEYGENLDIHAYCFACPSAVTLDLATKYRKYVTSVLHNYDIVPRLSFGSMEDLKHKIVDILEQSGGFFGRTFQIMTGLNYFSENNKQKLENFLKTPSTPNFVTDHKPRHSTRLWPPGKVIYMYKENDKFHVELSHPSLFSNIVIANGMLSDHMPHNFEESLRGCENVMLQTIKEKEEEEKKENEKEKEKNFQENFQAKKNFEEKKKENDFSHHHNNFHEISLDFDENENDLYSSSSSSRPLTPKIRKSKKDSFAHNF